jgi:hypothetical protein
MKKNEKDVVEAVEFAVKWARRVFGIACKYILGSTNCVFDELIVPKGTVRQEYSVG